MKMKDPVTKDKRQMTTTPERNFSNNLEQYTLVLVLKPLHRVFLGDSVMYSDSSRGNLTSGDSISGSDEHNEEVHTEDT